MAVRRVTQIGEEVLLRKARRVQQFDAELHTLLDDMRETMNKADGVGLAAPQVDISQRVIVVELPNDKEEYGDQAGQFFEAVNPEIIRHSREAVEGVEGCLSIPGYVGNVERYVSVIVRAQDRHGVETRIKAQDWLARVFQHEIDHLDGILFIDRTEEIWRTGEEPTDSAGEEETAAV
jgi:peptide deformylase